MALMHLLNCSFSLIAHILIKTGGGNHK